MVAYEQIQGHPPFFEIFQNCGTGQVFLCVLCGEPDFLENVLDAFTLKLPIQTSFSVVPTHSVFWCTIQFKQNKDTPERKFELNLTFL